MTRIGSNFKKAVLVLMLASLSLAALPAGSARAAGLREGARPGRGKDYVPRLERIFEAQQDRFDHQTQLLARADTLIDRVQGLIDRAGEKGLDASAVQAALDDFSAALPAGQAAHDQAGALIAAHAGFDDKGKVTDLAAAVGTVKGIHAAFRESVEALLPPFKALRVAIRTFVRENGLRREPAVTPSPTA